MVAGIVPADDQQDIFRVGEDRLQLLIDGPERLDALIALIDGARRRVRLLYYIYNDDESGQRVRDALSAAMNRGAAVSLIVDGFGSENAGERFFAPLEKAGATVCRFLPRWGRRYLLRNHQKLAIADDDVTIIGGFNISDDYFRASGEQSWRDLGLRLEGPVSGRIAHYFDAVADWTHEKNASIRKLRTILKGYSEKSGEVRWLLGGPTRRLSGWAECLRTDMRAATRLRLMAGYFAPNPAMLRGIESVARRGAASVITPSKTDHNAAIAAARHTYTRLLNRGVRIAEYQPAKLHTKLFVTDAIVHLGSANFDMRSLFINLEIMLRVQDEAFAARVAAYFDGEWANSREITSADHATAGLWTRTKWAAAYFVMAVVDANVTRRLNFGVEPEVNG